MFTKRSHILKQTCSFQFQRLKIKLGRSRILIEVTGFTPFTPYIIHLPVCNFRVVIDHTFMTICLNLADFTDFFLLETWTSLQWRFTLSVVAWARKLSCGQPNRLRDTKCNAFILTVSRIQVHIRTFLGEYVIYSFWWTQ